MFYVQDQKNILYFKILYFDQNTFFNNINYSNIRTIDFIFEIFYILKKTQIK